MLPHRNGAVAPGVAAAGHAPDAGVCGHATKRPRMQQGVRRHHYVQRLPHGHAGAVWHRAGGPAAPVRRRAPPGVQFELRGVWRPARGAAGGAGVALAKPHRHASAVFPRQHHQQHRAVAAAVVRDPHVRREHSGVPDASVLDGAPRLFPVVRHAYRRLLRHGTHCVPRRHHRRRRQRIAPGQLGD